MLLLITFFILSCSDEADIVGPGGTDCTSCATITLDMEDNNGSLTLTATIDNFSAADISPHGRDHFDGSNISQFLLSDHFGQLSFCRMGKLG